MAKEAGGHFVPNNEWKLLKQKLATLEAQNVRLQREIDEMAKAQGSFHDSVRKSFV